MDLDLENHEERLDFFVREAFQDVAVDDELKYEDFCQYFKNQILKRTFSSDDFFLDPDEKRLQYAGRNMIEPTVEYLFLIRKAETRGEKLHYAEKGARFSVAIPAITGQVAQGHYYGQIAQMFYSMVASNTRSDEGTEFFSFLADLSPMMVDGLVQIIDQLEEDGRQIMQKEYIKTVAFYSVSTDDEKDAYAREMVGLARKLKIPSDEIPLEKEHYRLLFL
ncbi:MAG: hypothetical protein ACOC32_03610 [Nanoarchaeota archaeon]